MQFEQDLKPFLLCTKLETRCSKEVISTNSTRPVVIYASGLWTRNPETCTCLTLSNPNTRMNALGYAFLHSAISRSTDAASEHPNMGNFHMVQ